MNAPDRAPEDDALPEPDWVPLTPYTPPAEGPTAAARAFHDRMESRRSIREFSDRPVSRETLEWVIRAAGTAPSGANKQPWRFICISDPATKHAIRVAVEQEEREFYTRRASRKWLHDLAPLGTDEDKAYLEVVPWIVVVMKLVKGDDGEQVYYTDESVGLATGLFLAAAHHAGLATLTHTPSPMRFLCDVLERPDNERPFVLIPVGYPADDCKVPAHALTRKPLDDVSVWVE